MIVLDTNVVSALMRGPDASMAHGWLDRQPSLSVWTTTITVLEVRFGIARLDAGRRRDALTAAFAQVVDEDLQGRILAFDQASAEQAALLMAKGEVAGRPGDLRDRMIAGIVLARRATLATRNTKHFEHSDINLSNPWDE